MDLHLYKENCLALVICYVVGLLNLLFATLWQFSCSHTISYGSVVKDRSFFWGCDAVSLGESFVMLLVHYDPSKCWELLVHWQHHVL
jgi:hypothetical protein